jgi:hypothetical protein
VHGEKEVHVSDRLKQSLLASRSEIEAGLSEAEAELGRIRDRARELEELIALGTATLLAAEMLSGGSRSAPVAAGADGFGAALDPTAAGVANDKPLAKSQK